ncbi:hypothetical protein DIPPA_21918 [Diplonema papillatum]|nr:hypothetical protein DIPPA_21918 [Diplonema papillatum]
MPNTDAAQPSEVNDDVLKTPKGEYLTALEIMLRGLASGSSEATSAISAELLASSARKGYPCAKSEGSSEQSPAAFETPVVGADQRSVLTHSRSLGDTLSSDPCSRDLFSASPERQEHNVKPQEEPAKIGRFHVSNFSVNLALTEYSPQLDDAPARSRRQSIETALFPSFSPPSAKHRVVHPFATPEHKARLPNNQQTLTATGLQTAVPNAPFISFISPSADRSTPTQTPTTNARSTRALSTPPLCTVPCAGSTVSAEPSNHHCALALTPQRTPCALALTPQRTPARQSMAKSTATPPGQHATTDRASCATPAAVVVTLHERASSQPKLESTTDATPQLRADSAAMQQPAFSASPVHSSSKQTPVKQCHTNAPCVSVSSPDDTTPLVLASLAMTPLHTSAASPDGTTPAVLACRVANTHTPSHAHSKEDSKTEIVTPSLDDTTPPVLATTVITPIHAHQTKSELASPDDTTPPVLASCEVGPSHYHTHHAKVFAQELGTEAAAPAQDDATPRVLASCAAAARCRSHNEQDVAIVAVPSLDTTPRVLADVTPSSARRTNVSQEDLIVANDPSPDAEGGDTACAPPANHDETPALLAERSGYNATSFCIPKPAGESGRKNSDVHTDDESRDASLSKTSQVESGTGPETALAKGSQDVSSLVIAAAQGIRQDVAACDGTAENALPPSSHAEWNLPNGKLSEEPGAAPRNQPCAASGHDASPEAEVAPQTVSCTSGAVGSFNVHLEGNRDASVATTSQVAGDGAASDHDASPEAQIDPQTVSCTSGTVGSGRKSFNTHLEDNPDASVATTSQVAGDGAASDHDASPKAEVAPQTVSCTSGTVGSGRKSFNTHLEDNPDASVATTSQVAGDGAASDHDASPEAQIDPQTVSCTSGTVGSGRKSFNTHLEDNPDASVATTSQVAGDGAASDHDASPKAEVAPQTVSCTSGTVGSGRKSFNTHLEDNPDASVATTSQVAGDGAASDHDASPKAEVAPQTVSCTSGTVGSGRKSFNTHLKDDHDHGASVATTSQVAGDGATTAEVSQPTEMPQSSSVVELVIRRVIRENVVHVDGPSAERITSASKSGESDLSLLLAFTPPAKKKGKRKSRASPSLSKSPFSEGCGSPKNRSKQMKTEETTTALFEAATTANEGGVAAMPDHDIPLTACPEVGNCTILDHDTAPADEAEPHTVLCPLGAGERGGRKSYGNHSEDNHEASPATGARVATENGGATQPTASPVAVSSVVRANVVFIDGPTAGRISSASKFEEPDLLLLAAHTPPADEKKSVASPCSLPKSPLSDISSDNQRKQVQTKDTATTHSEVATAPVSADKCFDEGSEAAMLNHDVPPAIGLYPGADAAPRSVPCSIVAAESSGRTSCGNPPEESPKAFVVTAATGNDAPPATEVSQPKVVSHRSSVVDGVARGVIRKNVVFVDSACRASSTSKIGEPGPLLVAAFTPPGKKKGKRKSKVSPSLSKSLFSEGCGSPKNRRKRRKKETAPTPSHVATTHASADICSDERDGQAMPNHDISLTARPEISAPAAAAGVALDESVGPTRESSSKRRSEGSIDRLFSNSNSTRLGRASGGGNRSPAVSEPKMQPAKNSPRQEPRKSSAAGTKKLAKRSAPVEKRASTLRGTCTKAAIHEDTEDSDIEREARRLLFGDDVDTGHEQRRAAEDNNAAKESVQENKPSDACNSDTEREGRRLTKDALSSTPPPKTKEPRRVLKVGPARRTQQHVTIKPVFKPENRSPFPTPVFETPTRQKTAAKPSSSQRSKQRDPAAKLAKNAATPDGRETFAAACTTPELPKTPAGRHGSAPAAASPVNQALIDRLRKRELAEKEKLRQWEAAERLARKPAKKRARLAEIDPNNLALHREETQPDGVCRTPERLRKALEKERRVVVKDTSPSKFKGSKRVQQIIDLASKDYEYQGLGAFSSAALLDDNDPFWIEHGDDIIAAFKTTIQLSNYETQSSESSPLSLPEYPLPDTDVDHQIMEQYNVPLPPPFKPQVRAIRPGPNTRPPPILLPPA